MSTHSKYHARVTWVDGIRFASGMEARRYGELRLLLAAGLIADLECQPRFPLVVNGCDCGLYVGDFRYTDTATGQVVTEDVKGFRTDVFALKKKLVRALYAVEIVEVKA